MGAVAVALIILLATFPVLVPFLVFRSPELAVRISNLMGLVLLFWVGMWWGRTVGASPWKVGAGVAGLGAAMVLVTIALGG